MNIDISKLSTEEKIELLLSLSNFSIISKEQASLSNNADEEILDLLLKGNNDIKYMVAKYISKKILLELALSNDYHIKLGVVENKNTNEEILEILLKDKYNNIRYHAAKHSNLSLERLRELVSFSDFYIKKGILFNNNADGEILDILSEDFSSFIRRSVSLNKNTSAETLIKLYEEFPDNVLANPNCPEWIKVLSR